MSGTGLVTAGVWLEQFLDHHVEAGSRAKFHFSFLSNLEAFHRISGAFWDIQATLLNVAPGRSLFLLKIKDSFAKVAQSDLIF